MGQKQRTKKLLRKAALICSQAKGSNNNNKKEKEIKMTLPRPGIIQSSCKLSGFEPGTFRSSVWRSPNWAISATDV